MSRWDDLDRFYDLLENLEERVDGMQRLHECTGYMNWPDRGVYFFFADDEWRRDADHRRLTRVGTQLYRPVQAPPFGAASGPTAVQIVGRTRMAETTADRCSESVSARP